MRRGTRVAQAYVAVTADGSGINEEIVDSVEAAGPGVERAGEDHGERYGDNFSEGFFARLRGRFGSRVSAELGDSMDRSGRDAGDRLGSALVHSLRERLTAENDRVSDLVERILSDNGRSDKRMLRLTTALTSSERAANRLNAELTQTLRIEGLIGRQVSRNLAASSGGNQGSLGDRVGSLFGAGSRNNFLNVLGKSLGNAVNLTQKLGLSVVRLGSDLSTAATSASSFGGAIANIGGVLGGRLASLGGAITGVGAAALLILPILSLLASALVGLAGIVAALSATIATGLVGALLVGAGGLGAFVLAAGATAIAIASLDKAQKKFLKQSFRPLKNEFLGLGQLLVEDLVPALGRFSEQVQRAIVPLGPVFKGLGTSIGKVVNQFGASLQGDNFLSLFVELGDELPGIIEKFGSASTKFASGLSGSFALLLPFVDRFAKVVDAAAGRFDRFVASTQGQNRITEFFERAYQAAAALGRFLGELSGLISDVLLGTEGNAAGETIFDGLTESIARFRAYIAGDGLTDFFANAEEAAAAMGKVLLGLGDVFVALTNSGSLQLVNTLFSSLGSMLTLLSPAISGVLAVMGPLATGLSTLTAAFGQLDPKIGGLIIAIPLLAFAISRLSFNPIVVGITAVVVGIGLLVGGINTVSDATKRYMASVDAAGIERYGESFRGLYERIVPLYNAYTNLVSSSSDFANGLRQLTNSGFRQSVADMKALTDQLVKLRPQITETASSLGLSTRGWEDLSAAAFIAKAELTAATYALQQLGYDTDLAGDKVIDFNTALLDNRGADALNLSATAVSRLRGELDLLTPARIEAINAEVGRLIANVGAAGGLTGLLVGPLQGQSAFEFYQDAKDAYRDYVASIANQLDNLGSATATNYQTSGAGAGPGRGPKPYKNPYGALAASLIKDGPSIARQIKDAINTVNQQVASAVRDASTAVGAGEVRNALSTVLETLTSSGQTIVDNAQSALNSAAQSLASAGSKKDAAKALKAVRKAQAALTAALKNQELLERQFAKLAEQKIVTEGRVDRLVEGLEVENATLADLAAARGRVADLFKRANDKLKDRISERNDFAKSVEDSVRDFGSILNAQAQSINGIEQALTAGDIVGTLQDRLAKIRKFQDNLRILVAQGLSDSVYKQLVDAGVEQGSAYADALIAGGMGAISTVNQLTGQIDNVAEVLGTQVADRLYLAGIATAQGVVDGLDKLDNRLKNFAERLGNAIANAVKDALSKKPGAGNRVGGQGSNNRASASVSSRVAVSPEVAAYADRQGASPTVSGNDGQKFRDLVVVTPTENPEAVAHEVLNEIIGRL